MSWFPWFRGSVKTDSHDTFRKDIEDTYEEKEEEHEEQEEITQSRCLSVFQPELQAYHSRR